MARRSSAVQAALPRWSKYVMTEGGGRDPLGLARVSGLLADQLLPGIVVNTDRARYYAAYAWMISHVESTEKPSTRAEFELAFQRRESALAYATLLESQEDSVVGKRAVGRRLAKGEDSLPLEIRVLPSNALGGYGQYYAGSLYRIGMTFQLEDGIPRLAPPGERIASAFAASIAKTAFLQRQYFRHKHMTREALERDAPLLSLNGIHSREATSERKTLIDAMFELPDADVGLGSFRPLTLCRILHLLREYAQNGLQMGGLDDLSLDHQLLIGPSYFGHLMGQEDAIVEYSAPDWLEACDGLWRQFALHEFLSWALEGILASSLQVLSPARDGLTLDELVEALLSDPFREALSNLHGRNARSPKMLLSSLKVSGTQDPQGCTTARESLGLRTAPNEYQLFDGADSPQERLANSVSMLSLLYAKWRDGSDDPHWREVRRVTGAELSTPLVLPLLDSWLATETDWHTAVSALIEVLAAHHDRIMYEKARLDACWIRQDGQRYLCEQYYDGTTHQSRHWQALQILEDLELVRRAESGAYTLTPAGERILASVEELRS